MISIVVHKIGIPYKFVTSLSDSTINLTWNILLYTKYNQHKLLLQGMQPGIAVYYKLVAYHFVVSLSFACMMA